MFEVIIDSLVTQMLCAKHNVNRFRFQQDADIGFLDGGLEKEAQLNDLQSHPI